MLDDHSERRKLCGERGADARPELRVVRRQDGRLCAELGERRTPVRVARCFPWSEPARFISLRDDEDAEVALVGSLGDLDAESRGVLERALLEAGFVLEVTGVLDISEEIEIRHWCVETRHGRRSFQTHQDDWPREMPGGGLLIRDVSSDLYYVPRPAALDRRSRRLLWAFID